MFHFKTGYMEFTSKGEIVSFARVVDRNHFNSEHFFLPGRIYYDAIPSAPSHSISRRQQFEKFYIWPRIDFNRFMGCLGRYGWKLNTGMSGAFTNPVLASLIGEGEVYHIPNFYPSKDYDDAEHQKRLRLAFCHAAVLTTSHMNYLCSRGNVTDEWKVSLDVLLLRSASLEGIYPEQPHLYSGHRMLLQI